MFLYEKIRRAARAGRGLRLDAEDVRMLHETLTASAEELTGTADDLIKGAMVDAMRKSLRDKEQS